MLSISGIRAAQGRGAGPLPAWAAGLWGLALWAVACAPPEGGGAPGLPGAPPEALRQVVDAAGDASLELRELSRPGQVRAWVDELIVKAQPGKDMPKVATLREGEIARYLYQRTLRKSEFSLRGQRFVEPWILIKTKDSIMGWVHEGGVRFLEPDYDDLLTHTPPGTPPRTTPGSRGLADQTQDAEDAQFRILPGRKVGDIGVNTSETALIKAFGVGNVARAKVQAGGAEEECTVILPGNNDELRLTWKDAKRTRVKAVYLLRPGARWHLPEGVRVGTPLDELVKANSGPLNFYGLGWAYGGTVSSFRGGALARYEKYGYVVLAPKSGSAPAPFQGNSIHTSNDPGADALDLRVARIVVYLD